ncbi:peptidoglycan-binding protein [Porticoccaceae bacterium]|nr:peptidoglycan-binding protein [Porticoccaceae bacterium]
MKRVMLRKAARYSLKTTNKALRFGGFCFLWCLPLQELVAQNSEDTSNPSRIMIDNEYWSIKQLSRIATELPSTTRKYAVFTISKNNVGEWVIGGSLKDSNTELLYVDRALRHIGPFTSSWDTAGSGYTCAVNKKESENIQRKTGTYNACRSEFFTADGVYVTDKLFNLVLNNAIACTLFLCMGGETYNSSWRPEFSYSKLKSALRSSKLTAQIAMFFQNLDRQVIDKYVEVSTDKTRDVLAVLNSIDSSSEDAGYLRSSLKRLNETSSGFKGHSDFFSNYSNDRSLPFRLGYKEILRIENASIRELNSTRQELDKYLQLITKNLDAIVLAERAIVSEIQVLLKDQRYYKYSVDGLFGAGTLEAIKTFSKDVDLPVERYDKPKILQSVKTSFIPPVGSCSKSLTDGVFVACFNIDNY